MRKLWKASKILACSIFDERLADYNIYDLELMEWLEYFDNPANIAQYRRSFNDPDFDDYWNEEAPEVSKELKEKAVDINNDDEWEEVDIDE